MDDTELMKRLDGLNKTIAHRTYKYFEKKEIVDLIVTTFPEYYEENPGEVV